jgi:hypothetical protein
MPIWLEKIGELMSIGTTFVKNNIIEKAFEKTPHINSWKPVNKKDFYQAMILLIENISLSK